MISDDAFAGLVAQYRRNREDERGRSNAATRTALRRINATLTSTAELIAEAERGVTAQNRTPTQDAWFKIQAYSGLGQGFESPIVRAVAVQGLLLEWAALATEAERKLPRKVSRTSVRLLADQMWATEIGRDSRASVMVRVARAAGDRALTQDAARKALKESNAQRGTYSPA